MRKRAIGLAITVLFVGGTLGAVSGMPSAGAAKAIVETASGYVDCQASGPLKGYAYWQGSTFNATVSWKLRAGCAGTTGNPAVTPKSGKLVAGFSYMGTDCNLPGSHYLNARWKASGGKILSGTSVVWTSPTVTASGWTMPAGTGTVNGSWGQDDSDANAVLGGPSQQLRSMCLAGPPAPGPKPPKPTKIRSAGSLQLHL